MNDKNIRYLGISAACLSIAVTGLTILYVTSGAKFSSETARFIFWTISPYAGLILGDYLIRKIFVSPNITRVFCVISVLLAALAIYAYVGSIGDQSLGRFFTFLFLPFYLNILVFSLTAGGIFWALLSKYSNK